MGRKRSSDSRSTGAKESLESHSAEKPVKGRVTGRRIKKGDQVERQNGKGRTKAKVARKLRNKRKSARNPG